LGKKTVTDLSKVTKVSLKKKSGGKSLNTGLIREPYGESSLLDGFPCFVYEADTSFRILRASANVREIIGIDQNRIIGVSWLFDEGVVPADRALLKQQLLELHRDGRASLIHRLIDDRGSIVRVAHGLQRINGRGETLIRGSVVPLTMSTKGYGVADDFGIVAKFLHKMGNHFQLLNLMQHSMRTTGSFLNELELLQETTEKAVDLSQMFSALLQQPALSTYVNLLELLESVLESRVGAGREKNLEISLQNVASLREATIQSDREFLEMAFGAILDDAIDASPIDGMVLVEISVPPDVSGAGINRTVIIEVSRILSDITTDFADPVLDPFHTNKPAGNGAGLGLASRYIELHGGLLRIYKRKAERTVVEITLPMVILPHARTGESLSPGL